MAKQERITVDISVVGGGVTGLMLTKKFTDLGYTVALVEKQTRLAGGPSTKNEGWLHRGTYHATSIRDETQALAVARRCIYGHEQWRQFAPEAVEDIETTSYAVISSEEGAERATERWDKAGVVYRLLTKDEFEKENPEVDTTALVEFFEVGDVSVNSKILYQKLATQARKGGAEIFLGSTLHPEGEGVATITQQDGEPIKVHSDKLIVTAGYGIGEMHREITGEELPVRYWKSHLVVMPRITQHNVFSLDPGEAALFNHGRNSVVGQHEDAVVEEHPNFTIIDEREKLVFKATERLFPGATQHKTSYQAVACIKPDIARIPGQARSLDIDVFRREGVIFVLPGKMTEAPYVADKVVQEIFEESVDFGDVALRPTDKYKNP